MIVIKQLSSSDKYNMLNIASEKFIYSKKYWELYKIWIKLKN